MVEELRSLSCAAALELDCRRSYNRIEPPATASTRWLLVLDAARKLIGGPFP